MQAKFDKLSLTSKSFTPERVETFANDQVNTLTPSQFKSLALHYKVGGETEAEQYNYFQNTSNEQIKKDLADSIVERFTPRGKELNKTKEAKPTSKYTKAVEQQININEGTAERLFEISEQLAKSGNPEELLATIKAQKPGTPIFSRKDYLENEYAVAKAKAE